MPFIKPPLHIHTLIDEKLENKKTGKEGFTIYKLVKLINNKNAALNTGCWITRKILQNIAENPEQCKVSYSALVALDVYFDHALRKRPIFETRGILHALVNSGNVVFMIGAKPRLDEQRTDVSHWDNRSIAILQTQLPGAKALPDIQHVLLRTPVDTNTIKAERWYQILEEDTAPVVSLGSSLAALSSEVMLARMFGLPPFVTPRFERNTRPFYFAWLKRATENFHSAFGLTHEELKKNSETVELARKVEANESSAFILGETPHEVPMTGTEWTMYGVITAQRRTNGNIWVVVSGLTGPATHAAAMKVNEITAEIPWPEKGKPLKALWVPVKVQIKAGPKSLFGGDVREIVSAEFDGEPRIWP